MLPTGRQWQTTPHHTVDGVNVTQKKTRGDDAAHATECRRTLGHVTGKVIGPLPGFGAGGNCEVIIGLESEILRLDY